jgi:tetratricopeptide (TPR) repeat protein
MKTDATYMMDGGTAVARMLHRTGRWDEALAVLPTGAVAVRAELLVDSFWWRLHGSEEAEEAVGALLQSEPVLAGYLDAQIRYTRLLFGLGPRPDDLQQARQGFAAARDDVRLAGWAAFWLGVLADNIDEDPDRAAAAYQRALEHAREHSDVLLESYTARHLGDHLLDHDHEQGIAHLRRSYHLRAALGARPQTAAAALTLACELPPGAEADQLREMAGLTAHELGLTWLLRAL